jgi:hypothetical protein
MFLHSSRPFRVEDFFKRPIKYQGIRFEGLPRQLFWNGYIEPFLKDIISRSINQTLELSKEQKVAVYSSVQETCQLLKLMVGNIYKEMAEVDLMLREERDSNNLAKREVNNNIAFMSLVVDDMADLALSKLKNALRSKEA